MNESTMQGYSNNNTIFAAFSREGFGPKLERLASELDCRVYWAEHPADLIAIPWFVAIVDRRVLGDHSWCLYEQYRAEIGESEPCILIDDGPPSSLALQQVPFLADSSEEELLKVIRAAHAMSSQGTSAPGGSPSPENLSAEVRMYQQGDVLIKRIPQQPIGAQPVETASGRIVLASGEVTGHSHVIECAEGAQCYTMGGELYLVVEKEVEVTHEEHQALAIPPGIYLIDRVREYDYLTKEARRRIDD